jgi:DNA-binding GntR family transcriptional regulator
MSPASTLRQLDGTTLADRAYEAIREAIVSGELQSREKITERGLAARLAVSATPVREALRRLEQDGLVQRTGPRSVEVVDFDARAVSEIRLAESALRAVAARLAATNATTTQLASMEAMLDAGDREIESLTSIDPDGTSLTSAQLAGILGITREFHAELNRGCNNPVVLRLLSMVDAFNLAARPRNLSAEVGSGGGRAAVERYADHRRIFEAVRDGDAARAERLMTEHTRAHSPQESSDG